MDYRGWKGRSKYAYTKAEISAMWRKQDRCGHCGVYVGPDRKMCTAKEQEQKESFKLRNQRWLAKARENGLCIECGKKKIIMKATNVDMCIACTAKKRRKRNEAYARERAKL